MSWVCLAGPAPAGAPPLVFTGQLVCSLKRAVPLPFPGVITSMEVSSGQLVEADTVLAKYRLSPEASLEVSRRLSPPIIKELEMKLAEAEKNLLELRDKRRSLTHMVGQNLASPQSLCQVEESFALMEQHRNALRGRLAAERQLASENLALLRQQLGPQALSGKGPREGTLRAPIKGYIIWIHPDLRVHAELANPGPVFLVGELNPMLVKAQVHEIEAVQLAEGDQAEVTLEALPGRTFMATLTRLPWASLTAAPDRPAYFEVEFTIANPDLLLKEGLKAQLVINRSAKQSP